jgi:hypothetical protein
MERRTTFFAAMALAVLLLWLMPTVVTAQDEEDIWDEPRPEWRRERFAPEPEMVDEIMERLHQSEPERARELEKLREENPEAFLEEMRDIVREQIRQRMRERREGDEQGAAERDGRRGWRPDEREGRDRRGEYMRERFRRQTEEYMEWLEQNLPDEAEELRAVQESSPEQWPRRLGISMRKYRRAFEASRTNPEMAKVLLEDVALKHRRYELLKELGRTTDEAEKERLTAELTEVVAQRYDLIVRRKQLAYEDLARRLEELQQEVQKNEAEMQKFSNEDFKAEHVKARVEELVSHTEKFNWEE